MYVPSSSRLLTYIILLSSFMLARSLVPSFTRCGSSGVRLTRSMSTSRPWLGRILGARKDTQLFNFFDRMKEEKDPGDVLGTKLKILKYPHPQLRAENEVVTEFDESLADKARQMLLVMYAADGIGLAAPQVGINQKLMVFNEMGDPESADKEMVLVNPSIVSKSDETNMREEGCLSFPQINGEVERSITIDVEYQTVTGEKKAVKLENFPARIFQHEYDHLDKVLFIDRFEERDQKVNKKRLDKYIKKYGPGGAP